MKERIVFLIVLIINFFVVTLYLIWNAGLVSTVKGKTKSSKDISSDGKSLYWMKSAVMLLCPVAGPLFFFCSWLFRLVFTWIKADLEDVVFSKERVRIQIKADEERARNILPLEEAVLVNEKKGLRTVMMNILKGNIHSSMSAITLALNIQDSETSHYAASILSDELNTFRIQVQKMRAGMQRDEAEAACGEMLLDYMDGVLKQKIFTDMEQRRFVHVMDETADQLYEKRPIALTAERCEGVCLRLLEAGDFEGAEKWCRKLEELHPEHLAAYTCKLRLYFAAKDKTAFFETLDSLKKSEVVIDHETLELIRLFG